jgi:hypothetical protein
MQNYSNQTGKSNITHYKIEDDKIFIKFKKWDEPIIYTYESEGTEHVENLKALALSGKGLSRYLQRYFKSQMNNSEYKTKKKSLLSKITLGWL